MNEKQAMEFCSIAAMGIACGLEHRYEWFSNYLSALSHGPHDEIAQCTDDAYDAMIAFEKRTASCSEEDEELALLNDERFAKKVNDWYQRARND